MTEMLCPVGKWLKKHPGIGPFWLRLVVGIAFIIAGSGKLAGISGVAGYFTSLGIPWASVMAWVVALGELLGGLFLLVGFLTRYAAMVLAIVMIVAIFVAHMPQVAEQGFNAVRLPLVLLAANLSLMFSGPGKWGIEQS